MFRNEDYDTKVDVFSFALILQEVLYLFKRLKFHIIVIMCDLLTIIFFLKKYLIKMIEGCQPFVTMNERDVPKLYAAKERPPFKAPSKSYAHGLKEYVLYFLL